MSFPIQTILWFYDFISQFLSLLHLTSDSYVLLDAGIFFVYSYTVKQKLGKMEDHLENADSNSHTAILNALGNAQ